MFTNHIYLIYMYKEDLALNNLQWLICHKTRPNQTNTTSIYSNSSASFQKWLCIFLFLTIFSESFLFDFKILYTIAIFDLIKQFFPKNVLLYMQKNPNAACHGIQLYMVQKCIFTNILNKQTLFLKQVYLTYRWNPNKYYISESGGPGSN